MNAVHTNIPSIDVLDRPFKPSIDGKLADASASSTFSILNFVL